ncbi:MAG: alpha/beta hydrolase [Clostridia bacterium]|nr:alpha/beta hydrolase [Clostridia bacterium]
MFLEFKGDKLDINYIEKGVGKTVVLLQGWGTKAEYYGVITDALCKYAHVLVPEFPGFGKTTEPSQAYDIKDYADFTLAFLEKLGEKDVTLIGHSHGGRVIIELASRENLPLNIEKAVLIDSAGIKRKKSFSKKVRIAFFKFCKTFLRIPFVKKAFPDALDKLQKKFGSADYASSSAILRQSMVKVINGDMTDKLHLIKVPTLLIWGDDDDATPLSDAKTMEKEIADCGLVVIKGGGHFSFLKDPALTSRVLESFLNNKTEV